MCVFVCVCFLPWGPLRKGVTSINIATQRDGGPADYLPLPPLYVTPLQLGAERLQGRGFRESHLSGHSLSQVCESHRTRGRPAHPHTSTERKTQKGVRRPEKTELSCGGGKGRT